MRIGMNAMQVRAAKSGGGQYIDGLLSGLLNVEHGDEFNLYCTRENAANYQFPAPNFHTQIWGLPEAGRTMRLLHQYAFLHGEIRRRGYDLFHGLSNFLPVIRVCPYVVSIHDLTYFVQPERCPPIRRRYWYTMTWRTVKVADAIITCSENSRRDLEHFFPDAAAKIHVVPLGVRARYRRLTTSRDESYLGKIGITQPYIAFLGTLEPGKNVARVIEAFDSIAADFPEHLLLIGGGKGWLYEEIFAAADRARHKDRIRFLGYLDDMEAVELLNFSEALCFPSLYEGFGLPPLEAMACGTPVITSNTSSIPEVVGDAALMVDPIRVDQIADAMRQVLNDAGLRHELRARGIAQAAKFSWDRTAEETLAVYRHVVSRA